ncbi:MAG: hypothetical protein J7L43_02670 [Candidatus Aenigmarchaeota archaeon]|nr:hypothetical protein [Candidatus Aenigmarchaeota archaeon]
MRRFCIICGKPAEIENFCCDCWTKRHDLFEIEDFEIIACHCGSYYHKGEWIKFDDLEELIREMIKSNMKTDNEIKKLKISLKKIGDTVYLAEIEAFGFVKPCKVLKKEKKKIKVRIRWRLCDKCKKKRANYYEAVFQVRDVDIPDEFVETINEYTSKIEEKRSGVDIYLIDKKIARNIVTQLRQMGFKIKATYELAGVKKGKKLYRNIYLIAKCEKNGRNSRKS